MGKYAETIFVDAWKQQMLAGDVNVIIIIYRKNRTSDGMRGCGAGGYQGVVFAFIVSQALQGMQQFMID